MTPFYIVAQQNAGNHSLSDFSEPLATVNEALAKAKLNAISRNNVYYVLECVAKITLPKPEPIVTMKGD